MATFAGKTPSTPGRAPGGGGGSAPPAGAAAAMRVGSVRVGSLRAGSARAVSVRGVSARAVSVRVGSRVGSLGRGRPANGAGAANATVLFPFTLKVFTATGWIGSLDPGAVRCRDGGWRQIKVHRHAAGAREVEVLAFGLCVGWCSAHGLLLGHFELDRVDLGPLALGSFLGRLRSLAWPLPRSSGAVRLVEAVGTYWLKSSRMRESRLPALDPPSTTATT